MGKVEERLISSEDLYRAASMFVGKPDKIVHGVHIYIGKTKADIHSKAAEEWFEKNAEKFRSAPLLIQETESKDALSVIPETNTTTDHRLSERIVEGLTVYASEELFNTRLLEIRFCVIANLCGGFVVNPGDGMLSDLSPENWSMEPWEDIHSLKCPYDIIHEALDSLQN